ncbi:hypothetical protein [Paenibacillus prosopidis]|uniref:hypothetical protein n=1 Tax=Paenibacillus prosopidis TaxID=630520 RepID=UPI0011C06FC0|nr:hypothetical protein [Paenibacillus prosopidis]
MAKMTDTKYARMWLVENDRSEAPALQYCSAKQALPSSSSRFPTWVLGVGLSKVYFFENGLSRSDE